MKTRILLFVASLLMLTGMASAKPLKVGLIAPFTGPLATVGASYKPAVKFVFDGYNAKAGDNGVDVVSYDDSSTTQGVADRFKQAIGEGVRVFLGGGTSALTSQLLADIKTWNRRNPTDPAILFIMVSEQAAFTGADCSFYTFRFATTTAMRVLALARVLQERGLLGQRIVSLQPEYSLGLEMEAAVVKYADQFNYKVVNSVRFPAFKLSDFSPIVEKVRASEPTVVITAVGSTDTPQLAKAVAASGLKTRFAGMYFDEPGTIGSAGDAILGTYNAGIFNAEAAGSVGEAFRKSFVDTTGVEPRTYVNNSIIAMQMLTEALKSLPPGTEVTQNNLVRAIEKAKLNWPMGEVSMRADDHQVVLPLVIVEASKDAKDKLDNTDIGLKPVKIVSAQDATAPVNPECKMERPN